MIRRVELHKADAWSSPGFDSRADPNLFVVTVKDRSDPVLFVGGET